jgi:A/G-specific adenine glycosylase
MRRQKFEIPDGLTPDRVKAFQRQVLAYYRRHGRALPWRTTRNPYHILVSEVMLQQTQVDRVIPKYHAFIDRFPDVAALAGSSLKEVLAVWQGLGYSRRAQALHAGARAIVAAWGGSLPATCEGLRTLPGIGPYTASAICVFAYNIPRVFIETNIRAVYIHTFFPGAEAVADPEIEPYVAATLCARSPRRWYNALMDYGVFIKKLYGNPARKSTLHTRQSPFEGSDRQIRGMIIRILGGVERMSLQKLVRSVGKEPARVRGILEQLEREGFVRHRGAYLELA